MKKDIKIGITGTLISLFLFALGMFITTNSSFTTFLQESPMAVKIVPAVLAYLCVFFGFFGIITFITVTIILICLEYHNKKVDKYNCKLIKEIKSELPKETEFSVNIANQNNEDLNKLLCEKLKCTALFNGSTVYIEFSLPEKVSLETDDVLWFNDNFNY